MTGVSLPQKEPEAGKGFTGWQVVGMVVGATCLAIFATALAVKLLLFPGPFKPVVLSDKEERQLEKKLAVFEGYTDPSVPEKNEKYNPDGSLQPEKYSEEGALREIRFSERELNAMVAKNTDLAEKLAVDLSPELISVKLLIPLDPDFPILGGQTLKLKAGAELAYRDGRPVVKLRGVSLMGVPVPNAWLGGIKNIDLVQEFGADPGFWQNFAEGVEAISVGEGSLQIRLKE